MFSFHKPKIYRSLTGCCICRAKSSSSRFTDSKRYENDFEKCFKVKEHRSGEICNACVLLVKRWKKLPSGSNRNWQHVVDARAGPGNKSMNRIKIRAKEEKEKKMKLRQKHKHRRQQQKNNALATQGPGSPGGLSDDIGGARLAWPAPLLPRSSNHKLWPSQPCLQDDDCLSDDSDYLSNSDASDDEMGTPHKTGAAKRKNKVPPARFSSFLDLTYWKKTEICCGIIFKGANGEVLLDTSLWRPCGSCSNSEGDKTPICTPGVASPASLSDEDSVDVPSHKVTPPMDVGSLTPPSTDVDTDPSSQGSAPPSYPPSTGPSTPTEPPVLDSFHDSAAQLDCATGILDLSLPKMPAPPVHTNPCPIQMEV